MEHKATLGYGIFLKDEVIESLNGEAAYEAAKAIKESDFRIGSYFEEYDGGIDVSYPAEILGMLAAYHPDFEAHLTYESPGDNAGFEDEEQVIIFITSTVQSVYHAETVEMPVAPSDEAIAILEKFCKTFIEDSGNVPAVSLLMAASSS